MPHFFSALKLSLRSKTRLNTGFAEVCRSSADIVPFFILLVSLAGRRWGT